MKKGILIILAVVIVALLGWIGNYLVDGGVRVSVPDEYIDDRILYNEITNSANEKYLKEYHGEKTNNKALPTDRKEVKKQLERDLTACEICVEKEIAITEEEAQEIAEIEFEALKTDEAQKNYYEALTSALEELGVSHKEYFELLGFESYCKYNNVSFKKNFESNGYDNNSKQSLDEQCEEYLEKNSIFGVFY